MSRNAGFSLVELLCAILILGVGLVGLIQGITTALSSNKESEVQTTAAFIAAGRIETLRADGFVIEGDSEGECGEGLSLYRWRESVTSTSIEGLYDIEVVIENSNSGKRIYELRTLLFDAPLYSAADESGNGKDQTRKREGSRQ